MKHTLPMTKRIVILFEILCLSIVALAENFTISGFVRDLSSDETIIGATVLDRRSGKGCVTNAYGFYSLTLAADRVELEYSYVGYEPQKMSIYLKADTTINIMLMSNTQLSDINVTAAQKMFGAEGSQMSAVQVAVDQIKSMPTIGGEADVIKSLQLLPGVQGGTEGSSGMYVRGGAPDENLLLLDGVPIYNVNHLFGFFSVFNADAIKSVTLYKGSFPARYGGRLSSVVDVRTNDGDMYHYKGKFSIGLISSKFQVEGPLWKGHTSFMVSGRRTYADVLIQPALTLVGKRRQMENMTAGYYFYDVNAKITHKFSDRDRLQASFYMGDDLIYANIRQSMTETKDSWSRNRAEQWMKTRWKWGNIVASLKWNHVINQQMFLSSSVNYTQYRYNMNMGIEQKQSMYSLTSNKLLDQKGMEIGAAYNSGINDVLAKTELDYSPIAGHNMKFGAAYTLHLFRPGVTTSQLHYDMDASNPIHNDTTYGDNNILAHETSLYAEDDMTLGSYVNLNAGLHYATYTVDGKFYHSLQPRLSLRIKLYDNLSLKTGYAYMNQYVHLLSNNNVSLPSDLWIPITAKVPPEKVHQASLGLFYDLFDWATFSVEGYYKHTDNMIEYRDGATFFGSTSNWENKVAVGRGWSYGVEFLAQRTIGNLTGWVAYTWSRSERLFDQEGNVINDGKVFRSKYDREHDISITASYKIRWWVDVSATWVYSTGSRGTLPLQKYYAIDPKGNLLTQDYISARNNYQYDDYHRLDLGINFHYHGRFKQLLHTWNLSVYNTYNRMNPFLIYQTAAEDGRLQLTKMTLFPIIPSISYTLQFKH